jgi:hypothetical protein
MVAFLALLALQALLVLVHPMKTISMQEVQIPPLGFMDVAET